MADIQSKIQSVLDRLVSDGAERGAQAAVYFEGKLIASAWAGVADGRNGAPVREETLFPVFSVTKGITATIVHQLAEKGLLSYDLRIADVWPEFATQGKDTLTLRHALLHTAGMPALPTGVTFREILDWDFICAALARTKPQWPPGEFMTYHAKTYGWLAGEVVRRIDGRPFSQIVREEICRPLGIETLHIGLAADAPPPSIAFIEEPGTAAEPILTETEVDTLPAAEIPVRRQVNYPGMWSACLPSTNGLMNARAIARHYAALVPGGVDGVELLPPSRVKIATECVTGADPQGNPSQRQLGYHPFVMEGKTGFGHGGYGGSTGVAWPELRLALGFTHNLLGPVSNSEIIFREITQALSL